MVPTQGWNLHPGGLGLLRRRRSPHGGQNQVLCPQGEALGHHGRCGRAQGGGARLARRGRCGGRDPDPFRTPRGHQRGGDRPRGGPGGPEEDRRRLCRNRQNPGAHGREIRGHHADPGNRGEAGDEASGHPHAEAGRRGAEGGQGLRPGGRHRGQDRAGGRNPGALRQRPEAL